MVAVAHADMLLSWEEHLPRHERPPEWMWPYPQELKVHFERVEQNRKDGVTPEDRAAEEGESENEYVRRALAAVG